MRERQEKDLIVVKVGTNILIDARQDPARLNEESFQRIGGEVASLVDDETAVALVSSGAIAAGVIEDGRSRDSLDRDNIVERQYYAARGWMTVTSRWQQALGEREVMPTLLTRHELDTKSTRSQMLGVAAFCLLEREGVLLVNENDTIDPSEIKLGDNDTLAARLASTLARSGDYRSTNLVLLTNVDGLYESADDESTIIRTVDDIAAVESFAGDAYNGYSTGGMSTKVRAAKLARTAGVAVHIANGSQDQAIGRALHGEIGTYFPAV